MNELKLIFYIWLYKIPRLGKSSFPRQSSCRKVSRPRLCVPLISWLSFPNRRLNPGASSSWSHISSASVFFVHVHTSCPVYLEHLLKAAPFTLEENTWQSSVSSTSFSTLLLVSVKFQGGDILKRMSFHCWPWYWNNIITIAALKNHSEEYSIICSFSQQIIIEALLWGRLSHTMYS